MTVKKVASARSNIKKASFAKKFDHQGHLLQGQLPRGDHSDVCLAQKPTPRSAPHRDRYYKPPLLKVLTPGCLLRARLCLCLYLCLGALLRGLVCAGAPTPRCLLQGYLL